MPSPQELGSRAGTPKPTCEALDTPSPAVTHHNSMGLQRKWKIAKKSEGRHTSSLTSVYITEKVISKVRITELDIFKSLVISYMLKIKLLKKL